MAKLDRYRESNPQLFNKIGKFLNIQSQLLRASKYANQLHKLNNFVLAIATLVYFVMIGIFLYNSAYFGVVPVTCIYLAALLAFGIVKVLLSHLELLREFLQTEWEN